MRPETYTPAPAPSSVTDEKAARWREHGSTGPPAVLRWAAAPVWPAFPRAVVAAPCPTAAGRPARRAGTWLTNPAAVLKRSFFIGHQTPQPRCRFVPGSSAHVPPKSPGVFTFTSLPSVAPEFSRRPTPPVYRGSIIDKVQTGGHRSCRRPAARGVKPAAETDDPHLSPAVATRSRSYRPTAGWWLAGR